MPAVPDSAADPHVLSTPLPACTEQNESAGLRNLRQLVHISVDNAGDSRIAAGATVDRSSRQSADRYAEPVPPPAGRENIAMGGARKRLALQTISHPVALGAKLPGERQNAPCEARSNSWYSGPGNARMRLPIGSDLTPRDVLNRRDAFLQLQPIAILQASPFKAANADFQIGTARTEHLRNVNAPGYRQIAVIPYCALKHQMLPGLRRHSPADPYRPRRPALLHRRHRSAQTSSHVQTEYPPAELEFYSAAAFPALPTSRLVHHQRKSEVLSQ